MKTLVKAEGFIIRKSKIKMMIIPLLLVVYLLGIIINVQTRNEFLNDAYKEYVSELTSVNIEINTDDCVLGNSPSFPDGPKCGPKHYATYEIKRAEERLPIYTEYMKNINGTFNSMFNDESNDYHQYRIQWMKSAIIMEEKGYGSQFFRTRDLKYPDDLEIVGQEIERSQKILDESHPQMKMPYDLNTVNYFNNFFSKGGISIFVAITILFNLDIFVNEGSPDVEKSMYTQAYSRSDINASKYVVSIMYSMISVFTAILLGSIIIGIIWGFGDLTYPLLVKERMLLFSEYQRDHLQISSMFVQIIIIVLFLVVFIILGLSLLHCLSIYTRNTTSGLLSAYFILGLPYILARNFSKIAAFIPFSYSRAQYIFEGNFSILYGLVTLSLINILLFKTLIKVGNKQDLTGGV